MAEPVKDVPEVVDEAQSKAAAAAAEVKAEPVARVAPSGVSAAMEHMKAAAAALVPGQAEGAEEHGVAEMLGEAKAIAHEAANDVKGAMGKITSLFAK